MPHFTLDICSALATMINVQSLTSVVPFWILQILAARATRHAVATCSSFSSLVLAYLGSLKGVSLRFPGLVVHLNY